MGIGKRERGKEIGKKVIYLPETICLKIELRKQWFFRGWCPTSLSSQTIRTIPRFIHDNSRCRRTHHLHHNKQFRNQSSSIIESLCSIPAPTIRQEYHTGTNEGDRGRGNSQVIWPGECTGGPKGLSSVHIVFSLVVFCHVETCRCDRTGSKSVNN